MPQQKMKKYLRGLPLKGNQLLTKYKMIIKNESGICSRWDKNSG